MLVLFPAPSLEALETVQLSLVDYPEQQEVPLMPGQSSRLAPAAGEWLVAGTFNAPAFSVPTLNHLTLLDGQGHQFPLILERASLKFRSDRIVSVRLAFHGSRNLLASVPLRLIWNSQGAAVAENHEVNQFAFDFSHRDRYRSFTWKLMPQKINSLPFVMVEVIPAVDQHRWWYLLPLGILMLLLAVNRFYLHPEE